VQEQKQEHNIGDGRRCCSRALQRSEISRTKLRIFAHGFSDSTLYPSSGSSEDEYVKLKQPAAAGPKQSKPSRPGGARLGVTFVPGLIDDVDDAADLSEPLLSLQEVSKLLRAL